MLRDILTDVRHQILKQVETAVYIADGVDRLPGRDGSRPRRGRKTEQTSQHVKRLPPRGEGRNSLHPRHNTLELGDTALVLSGGGSARPGLRPFAAPARGFVGPSCPASLVGVSAVVGVVT